MTKPPFIERLDRILDKNKEAYERALREWRESFNLREPYAGLSHNAPSTSKDGKAEMFFEVAPLSFG